MKIATGPRPAEDAELVERRLRAILYALDPRDLGENGQELWFRPAMASDLQIRLGVDAGTSSYDRSANFTISYGDGHDAAPSALRNVVDRIKALDVSPIAGVANAFGAASRAVAATPATGAAHGEAEEEPITLEAEGNRDLNVFFLDLCARLAGDGRELPSLHWGFWPTNGSRTAADYDPFEAFSENLLAYLPTDAGDVLDVGCGMGASARLLAARGKRVTALSPIAHHCAAIERARLPGVVVRCGRFEDLGGAGSYDLLLFSESLNHFTLADAFFRHCAALLRPSGYLLMTDDLPDAQIRRIESQPSFRVLRAVDITANVAPTAAWWAERMKMFAAYHDTLLSVLAFRDSALAERVRETLAALESPELRALLSQPEAPAPPKGRYVIYLLQRR